jgi:hydrogenase maturation protease
MTPASAARRTWSGLNASDGIPPGLADRIRRLIFSERTILIGLGNPDRADDGAGLKIVLNWKARLERRAFLETEVSAETVVLDGLDDPAAGVFLFVDAADFSGSPGESRLFGLDDLGRVRPAFSTHHVPMDLLMGLIESRRKEAFLLGIQPGSMEPFGEMTGETSETVRRLSELAE